MALVNRCHSCGQTAPMNVLACPRCGGEMPSAEATVKRFAILSGKVGEYELGERLGEGAMGVVYQALHPEIGKRVAIKVLKAEVSSDKKQVDRLVTEARTVNAIRHRGIVDIFGLGTLPDGRQYVVMEYLEGATVQQLLEQHGPMAPSEVMARIDEVLSALQAAHAAGIVHRDIKPSNIFIVSQTDGTRYVKLLDFGLAKTGHGEGAVVGTPDYLSPEQARGHTTEKSDLYSLGATAYHMLTGQPPFPHTSVASVLVAHQTEPAPLASTANTDVPRLLADFVRWLMEKEPSRRPSSAETARANLARLRKELQHLDTARLDAAVVRQVVESMSPPHPSPTMGSRGGAAPRPSASPVRAPAPSPRLAVAGTHAVARPAPVGPGGVALAGEVTPLELAEAPQPPTSPSNPALEPAWVDTTPRLEKQPPPEVLLPWERSGEHRHDPSSEQTPLVARPLVFHESRASAKQISLETEPGLTPRMVPAQPRPSDAATTTRVAVEDVRRSDFGSSPTASDTPMPRVGGPSLLVFLTLGGAGLLAAALAAWWLLRH